MSRACDLLARDNRSVAQLAEHRSPKPGVGGSSPSTPASGTKRLAYVKICDGSGSGLTAGRIRQLDEPEKGREA